MPRKERFWLNQQLMSALLDRRPKAHSHKPKRTMTMNAKVIWQCQGSILILMVPVTLKKKVNPLKKWEEQNLFAREKNKLVRSVHKDSLQL